MCDLVYEGYFQGPWRESALGGGILQPGPGWKGAFRGGTSRSAQREEPRRTLSELVSWVRRAPVRTLHQGIYSLGGRGGASMGVYVASLPRCSGGEPERAGVKPGCGVKVRSREASMRRVSGSGSDPEQSCDAPTSQVSSESELKNHPAWSGPIPIPNLIPFRGPMTRFGSSPGSPPSPRPSRPVGLRNTASRS